jgi:cytochrome c-type biogenesis protein CcmH
MVLWIIFAAMTGICALLLLSRLARPVLIPADAVVIDSDVTLYRAQLSEIARDEARGLAGSVEAEGLRIEAGRRLLRAQSANENVGTIIGSNQKRRNIAAVLIMVTVPLGALAMYGLHGSPGLSGKPLASRLSIDPAQIDVAVALARIETHLAANPQDARGWAIVAPIYLRTARYDDAIRAFTALLKSGGPSPDILADLGEARVLAGNGIVDADARQVFDEALKLEPSMPKARFFLALAREQEGDKDKAIVMLRALLAESAPEAPWRDTVIERLQKLGASPDLAVIPRGGDAIAILPEADRSAVIRSMVDGLAARLKEGGGTLDEWLRLIRAESVLGEPERSRQSLNIARQKLAGDVAALKALMAIARELALEPVP